MKNLNVWTVILFAGLIGLIIFFPEVSFAQGFGGFESRVQGLSQKLITVVLPLLSVLGLIYAVFLALTGDSGAKARITVVVVCSIVGFLAPTLVKWIQSASGM